VNGACLTVTGRRGARFTVDVSPETMRRTTLGKLVPGTRINLERALRFGDRLGGHLVQGHVDGVGQLESIRSEGDWLAYRFRVPRTLMPYLVEKGSIAVDGVSLTVFACRGPSFTVALIPHTLKVTTLGERKPGDRVNLEADVLLKQIEGMLRARRR
jgi:riboflavin synthase